MKFMKFLMTGILFGIVLSKSEVISWYRIYEMFNFQSFHMFGIIGSAVVLGAIITQSIKKFDLKSIVGESIQFNPKVKSFWRYLLGGTFFGLGWAMTGACPGPMFVLVGHGASVFLLVITSAMFGTFLYGVLRKYLPH
ncbi:YeeE/YedE family protein [Reichenbachiella carrageenanivorans]|uniref:YeeE/YedE family protein n=1 Tax=Reichenbachiella carrageenanivorans TaxID=2979869 RepID=A0ABY6D544_9BACT|nr:YeeE/YedE family protein [Reichenbachiella carrageenanivorans]UXX81261.1 YeeE/YedE family protein [Reichenbachiella carrageenanivorans]